MGSISMRSVILEGRRIEYTLERKKVKNLNLRVRRDGSVYISAHALVSAKQVDAFLVSKGSLILDAQKRILEKQRSCQPKRYVSGEQFLILGNVLRLEVAQASGDRVCADDSCIYLQVRDTADRAKKERLVQRYLDQRCKAVFTEIIARIHPVFEKYAVAMPALRIRNMRTRWGSCAVYKGIITLNKRLLEAPESCIEYVVMHEFCHFIHPDHSERFYTLLSAMMPDWKERKELLENSVTAGI